MSAILAGNGILISRSLYHPWGTTRYSQGASPTDYAYTGQMQEGDIYFYNARWYDPQLGRFMQADTIVPTFQGTQGFDRYAYINNNPVNGTDPSGNSAISEYFEGVALEFLSDMTYGAFDALITNKSDSEYFQDGRYLGRGLAQVANLFEVITGGGMMSGGVAVMTGTGGLGLAFAGPTGGGSVAVAMPLISVEAVPLVGGFALTAHGVSSIMFSSTRKIDSVPPITRKGMLGEGGTQTTSSQLWQGKQGRLDVENPSPGNRPGSIHFQPWGSNLKFQYNPYERTFLPSGKVPVPNYLQDLLSSDRGFIRSIIKGLRYLGEYR